MCEQTPFSYQSGQVVWVKLGSCWWPGEARSYDELPEDAKMSFKKVPFTVVQFFEEEKYEYVRNYDQVCLYNCKRKNEFIQKGLEMLRKHKNENFMNKFPSDVIRAEQLTNGDPNIIKNFQSMPDERPDYNIIFGKNGKSPRKGRSPSKLKRRSLPSRQKMDLNVLLPENKIPFGRRSDSALCQPKGDHTLFIRVQPRPEKDDADTNVVSVTPTEQVYSCSACDFKTKRIEGFMAHRKSHLSSAYGAPRPQIITPKKSRKKSEGTGGKKRSSYPPSANSQSSASKKRSSHLSKSQESKIKAREHEVSKADNSKLVENVVKGQKKKIVSNGPESSEMKSLIKPPSSKKKTPRKRKNEDVFKTQLLADWDDEDPSLLQQEEERIKKKCRASCFDFDDSADSILDTELEERANKFARTRNIPIISKPDSGAKKQQRLDDLPSTSREVQSLNKRPSEEYFRPNKRSKPNVDQNEEAYTKLVLDDAVPEYEPQLNSPSTLPFSENNNIVVDEFEEAVKRPVLTVDAGVKTLPQVPCMPNIPGSSADQDTDVCVLEVSDEGNSSEGVAHADEQDNSEVIFCDEQHPLHSKVKESVAELTEGDSNISICSVKDCRFQNDGARSPPTSITAEEQTESTEPKAAVDDHIMPKVSEEELPLEVEPKEAASDQRDLNASNRKDFVGSVREAVDGGESARTGATDVASSRVPEAENLEHSSQSELKQDGEDDEGDDEDEEDDDGDDDMPEIICVEHRAPRKTVFFHSDLGGESEISKRVNSTPTKEVEELVGKHSDEIDVSSPDELLSLEERHSRLPTELSNYGKDVCDEIDVSCSNDSSLHSEDIDHGCGDVEGADMRTAYDASRVNKETEEEVLEGDNAEEITIIGYRCGTSTDFKGVDDAPQEKDVVASLDSSSESSAAGDLPESGDTVTSDPDHVTECSNGDSALIKILDGSADDKLESEEICVEEDSSSTKEDDSLPTRITDSSKAEVSREEIVAEWSDEFDEDNHIDTSVKDKTIEVIDLDKSENESEDVVEDDDGAADARAAGSRVLSGTAERVTEQEKGEDVMVLKTVPVADLARVEEMELDINSMPVVMEDAVIKDDGGSNYDGVPPSTSHISVVGTSAPASLPPKTTSLLLNPATTAVKTLANNIIVVSSQSRQLPLTARGVFTSPHSKVVIMPRAARGKKLAPMLVANSSGLTARVYTESEQESLFKEGRKTLLQTVKPKISIQTSKTKPLLPNIQKNESGAEDSGMKIIQSKGVVMPGASLVPASPSGVATAVKVDSTGMKNVTVQGTLPKILVRSGTSKIVLQKSMSNLAAVSSGTGPQGLKRLTNIFPLVKGSGPNTKQLVISQPSTKPLKVQTNVPSAPVQLFPKSQLQPLKKARRMFTCQGSKTSPSLKSVPTTTIEISVSGVQSAQPAVTLAPTVQRGVNVSAIPRIPSSTIALPGTPVSTASSIMVGSQDSPSFVFIVDSGNIQHYNATPNILGYNSSTQSATPQPVYLEPSPLSTSTSLDNMVITLDGTPGNTATSSVFKLAENLGPSPVFVTNSSSGKDILATALANTEVFQPEACLQDTLAVVSNEQSISEATAMLPALHSVVPAANPSEVLESLTLKEPIMTPHEVPSCVTSAPVSLHASLAASPSMPLLTDDPMDHVRSPTLELYENSASQDGVTIQANSSEEPRIIGDEGR